MFYLKSKQSRVEQLSIDLALDFLKAFIAF